LLGGEGGGRENSSPLILGGGEEEKLGVVDGRREKPNGTINLPTKTKSIKAASEGDEEGTNARRNGIDRYSLGTPVLEFKKTAL